MNPTKNRSDSLFSVAQIRAVEGAALSRLLPHAFMQRASEAAAQAVSWLLSAPGSQLLPQDASGLVVKGPGNNASVAGTRCSKGGTAGTQYSGPRSEHAGTDR